MMVADKSMCMMLREHSTFHIEQKINV